MKDRDQFPSLGKDWNANVADRCHFYPELESHQNHNSNVIFLHFLLYFKIMYVHVYLVKSKQLTDVHMHVDLSVHCKKGCLWKQDITSNFLVNHATASSLWQCSNTPPRIWIWHLLCHGKIPLKKKRMWRKGSSVMLSWQLKLELNIKAEKSVSAPWEPRTGNLQQTVCWRRLGIHC